MFMLYISVYLIFLSCRSLLRVAALLLFRPFLISTPQDMSAMYDVVQTCLISYHAIAEYYFGEDLKGFKFTYKAHMNTAHLVNQCRAMGHPSIDNDLFVERALRSKACKACK